MAGIYLHVPFCHAKCAYCDFYSTARTDRAAAFVDAAIAEYDNRKSELSGEPVTTLYFGGGTPSVLPVHLLTKLADTLLSDSVEEFTIEVNPEDVNSENVRAWRDAGVNRVSMGVQSLIDAELKAINRRHNSTAALRAIDTILECGIGNISADLIYGLPGQTLQSWENSVNGLLSTGIRHLSAYCLSYEPGTLLTRRRDRGEIKETSEDDIVNMYGALCSLAAGRRFEHYEVSNFALPGFRSRHNSSYWKNIPYLGIGPGAHSLAADMTRRYNPPDIKTYLTQGGLTATVDEECETDRINDRIMVSLRTCEGLDTSLIPTDFRQSVIRAARQWINNGHIIADGTYLRIPESSWLLSDAIIRDLLID